MGSSQPFDIIEENTKSKDNWKELYEKDGESLLPLDLEVTDSEVIANHLTKDETLCIKYNDRMSRYSLETRSWIQGWTYHYPISLDQARRIVDKGFARWWLVPVEKR